jgi:hypothetical protein
MLEQQTSHMQPDALIEKLDFRLKKPNFEEEAVVYPKTERQQQNPDLNRGDSRTQFGTPYEMPDYHERDRPKLTRLMRLEI